MTVGHVIVGVAIALIVLNVALIAPLRMRLANGHWGRRKHFFQHAYWEMLLSSLGWTVVWLAISAFAAVVGLFIVGIMVHAFQSPL